MNAIEPPTQTGWVTQVSSRDGRYRASESLSAPDVYATLTGERSTSLSEDETVGHQEKAASTSAHVNVSAPNPDTCPSVSIDTTAATIRKTMSSRPSVFLSV